MRRSSSVVAWSCISFCHGGVSWMVCPSLLSCHINRGCGGTEAWWIEAGLHPNHRQPWVAQHGQVTQVAVGVQQYAQG